jgi:EmrB/QacA subfamily drug resistance transporter
VVERSSQRQSERAETRNDEPVEKLEDDGQEDIARLRAKRRAERQPNKDESRVSRQDQTEEEDEAIGRRALGLARQHPLAATSIALFILIAAAAAIGWWVHARNYESTDDAFIDARIVPISAQVAGEVVELPVTDNQLVRAGGELVQIDQRNYRAALDQARGLVEQAQATVDNLAAQLSEQQAKIAEAKRQVAEAKGALDFSQQEYARYQDLAKTGAGTVQRAQQASSDLTQKQASYDAAVANEASEERQIKVLQAQQEEAQAQLDQAKAQQELAEINLVRTKVVAPVGPTLGGWITDNWSWHWIFFINAPVGLLSLGLVNWLVVEPELLRQERRSLIARGLNVDWVGFLLIAVALGCLEVVLDKGQREDWFASNFIITFAATSAISFALFFPWELLRKDPIVDVRLLFQRQFGTSFLMMMVVGAILFSTIQLQPQLVQQLYDYDATTAGLSLMAGGIAMLLMMPVVGQLSQHVQPKYMMAFGMGLVALSMWHSTSLDPDASFNYFSWMRVFQTIGLPFIFVPITSVSYADVPADRTGQASALINVARNLGGSIGGSLATTMLARREQFHQFRLTEHLYQSSVPLQNAIRQGSEELIARGTPPPDAQHQAIGVIEQMLQQQAGLISYMDVYFVFAILACIMIFAALLLLRRVKLGDAHGGA